MKGSGVVFTRGEGISTPHVRPKGRQPLIECANMTLIFYVPFYVLISFIPFLYFSLFEVNKSGALAPTYPPSKRKSDLRSSFLRVNQEILFYLEGGHFKALDLKMIHLLGKKN